ncbi:MAG: DoxX family protein [Gemmatimonadetes bacterium]|nr:DoxX family protein [Gemmatimonadota bacterium]MBA4160254.1 DoxX family protein [Gemmatimonadota bacterium]
MQVHTRVPAPAIAEREASWWARSIRPATIALLLRAGLGLVMVSGGLSKLSQLLDPARRGAILEMYWGPLGYVNTFFDQYLFEGPLGGVLTPWLFLTSLSAFEFVAGALLIAGVLVRPLALVWGLLFWSFVAALPVATAAGVDPVAATHHTPALLVLIRDIGLSGLFFTLFIIGSGSYSVDERWIGPAATRRTLNWDALGLLLRLSVALPLLVGGAFHGYGHIQTFGMPALLILIVALALILNVGVRAAGVATVLIMGWFIISNFDLGRSLVANMNAVKREYAFFAAGIVLAYCGGGRLFNVLAGRSGWARLLRPGSASADHSAPMNDNGSHAGQSIDRAPADVVSTPPPPMHP